MEQVEDSAECNAVCPYNVLLEDDRCKYSDYYGKQDTRKSRHLDHAYHDDNDEWQEYENIHVECVTNSIDDLCSLRIIVISGVRFESEDRVKNECDKHCRTCCRNHSANVIEQSCVGYSGSEVCCIGEW